MGSSPLEFDEGTTKGAKKSCKGGGGADQERPMIGRLLLGVLVYTSRWGEPMIGHLLP